MKLNKTILLILLGLFAFCQVGKANATCSQDGNIVRAVSTVNSVIYYYIAPSSTGITPYNVYFLVRDTDMTNANMLLAALAGGHRVSILGSATSCPTTGPNRFGGEVQTVNVLPRY